MRTTWLRLAGPLSILETNRISNARDRVLRNNVVLFLAKFELRNMYFNIFYMVIRVTGVCA